MEYSGIMGMVDVGEDTEELAIDVLHSCRKRLREFMTYNRVDYDLPQLNVRRVGATNQIL